MLLVFCLKGEVLYIQPPNPKEIASSRTTYELTNVSIKTFKFLSIISKMEVSALTLLIFISVCRLMNCVGNGYFAVQSM